MYPAQCKQIPKGTIRTLFVSLDSELAPVGDKSVGLRRRDTPLALRHREDIRNFDEPTRQGTSAVSVASRFSKAAVFGVASSWNSQAMAMEQSTTNAALSGGPPECGP